MTYIHDFLRLFYPEVCLACGNTLFRNEATVCTRCHAQLPVTGYHLEPGNPVEKIFWGRCPVAHATSLCHFRRGTYVQQLLHQFKYKGKKEIGRILGKLLVNQLSQASWFAGIDCLVPVPLHPAKQRRRGYNQSIVFGQEMAAVSGKPLLEKALVRKIFTDTQTKKSRISRWENVEEVFGLSAIDLAGKHVLLLDDIVTTGATLEACVRVLTGQGNARVSIATLACAGS